MKEKIQELERQIAALPIGYISKKTINGKTVSYTHLDVYKRQDLLRAEKSIGTLGGGNHFIEVDKDDEGNLYIVVHSGSRHLGVEVSSCSGARRRSAWTCTARRSTPALATATCTCSTSA